MLTKLLAVVASLASAVVVRDAAEFRAELARGAPYGGTLEVVDSTFDNVRAYGIDGDAETLSRDFKPGTNAQRHRLHHAKHGHASGGLGLLMRRNSSRGLKQLRSGSTFRRSGSTASRTASRSDEEKAEAPVGRRPQLNRSATWRTSAPSVEM